MNHRRRVESRRTVSKPGRIVGPGEVQGEPTTCLDDTRHRGGVTVDQAFVWDVGNCGLDVKGEIQGADPQG